MTRARTVVTIGSFDGVHVGHASLVRRAHAIAEERGDGTRVVAMAFDPHPMTVLAPDRAPARLTTFEQRAACLGAAGADEVVRLEPTGNLLGLSPEEFFEHLVMELRPAAVVEGADFRFGRARAGDIATLQMLGEKMGFAVEVVPPVEVAMTDGTVVRASSSITRWLLENGRVRDATAVLGRPYEMVGVVERGDRRGRGIGFPTANLASQNMMPADGVYGGRATLEDGRELAAAISVGDKPTFDGAGRVVEAFLLVGTKALRQEGTEWEPIEGLPEYGWGMRLTFEHWVRDQVKFDGLPALLEQMGRDCGRIAEMMGGLEVRSPKESACP